MYSLISLFYIKPTVYKVNFAFLLRSYGMHAVPGSYDNRYPSRGGESVSVCVCVCLSVYVLCVCLSMLCVCVCVCVCVRAGTKPSNVLKV